MGGACGGRGWGGPGRAPVPGSCRRRVDLRPAQVSVDRAHVHRVAPVAHPIQQVREVPLRVAQAVEDRHPRLNTPRPRVQVHPLHPEAPPLSVLPGRSPCTHSAQAPRTPPSRGPPPPRVGRRGKVPETAHLRLQRRVEEGVPRVVAGQEAPVAVGARPWAARDAGATRTRLAGPQGAGGPPRRGVEAAGPQVPEQPLGPWRARVRGCRGWPRET